MPTVAIESLLISSREPPTGNNVLDNTIATDLDTAASISTGNVTHMSTTQIDKSSHTKISASFNTRARAVCTGTWNDPSPTSYWHVTTQPNFITKPKQPQQHPQHAQQQPHAPPIDKFMSPSMPSMSFPSGPSSSSLSPSWLNKPKSTKKPITLLTDDGSGSILLLENNDYHTYSVSKPTTTSTTSMTSTATTSTMSTKPKPQVFDSQPSQENSDLF